MRQTPALLRSRALVLCVFFFGAWVSGAAVVQPQPWHGVSCPARCTCQIKAWFSPESVLREAPTVDCNDLLLTHLPAPLPRDTHTLRLQSNLLSGLEDGALHTLPNLTDLDLSQNRFSGVAGAVRSPLASLLSLHLEENQLAHLPDASFSSLPALQELFLSHNRLRSLAPGVFAGLDRLLRLHLNDNRLTSVDPRWFKALPRLEVLMMGGNPVEALPERGFQALRSLRSLVLGGMGLRVLPEKALDGLDGLESLSFYDNLLTTVPTRALSRVPGLKFLDLNKNQIKLVQTGDFKNMVHLKELGLNNMEELVSIERASLENLPELTKLEITNNPRLSYIHPEAFARLGRLESLMLNSNSLSALHRCTLLSLPSLQEVSLHSNPLRCDCLFRWAAEEASHPHIDTVPHPDARAAKGAPRVVRFIQPQATLCSEPPELRARRVREVSAREMSVSCLPLIPPGPLPSFMGVREGGSLALHCRALAEPQPRLYWVTPSGLRLGPAPGNVSNRAPDPSPHLSPAASEESNRTRHSRHPRGQAQGRVPSDSGPYRLLSEGTLEIAVVTSNEAGLYTCVAENALGADMRSVTVGVHGRKRKGGVAAHQRARPVFRAGAGLEVREVGEQYAVLSWRNGRNLPSARLSWQAIYVEERAPIYTRRVLAGTQSFNLTHLQVDTLHHVCLHLGVGEGSKRAGRRARESGQPQCVSVRTKEAPEPRPSLPLSPQLTSTALTVLLLALILLLLVSQGWESVSGKEDGEYHSIAVQEVKSHEAKMTDQRSECRENHPGQSKKVSLNQDC